MIHLDSSFLIDLMREQRRSPGPATAWIDGHAGESLGISVFVACELEAGAAAAAHPEREGTRVRETLKALTQVVPDERFAALYGALLYRMQQRGRAIGTMDLLCNDIPGRLLAAIFEGNLRLCATQKRDVVRR